MYPKPSQVEHVKVWQTKTDYFFSPVAATSLAASEVAIPLTENSQDGVTHRADDDFNSLRGALLIVFCTLFAVALGGSAVVIFLSIRTRLERIRRYREISGSDHGSTPTAEGTM